MNSFYPKTEDWIAKRWFDCFSIVLICLASTTTQAVAGFTLFEATGANPTGITPIRNSFRAAVGGGTIADSNGYFGGLRREINWDGVPDSLSDPNLLPANFFNVNSPRGVVFSTPGTGFVFDSVRLVSNYWKY